MQHQSLTKYAKYIKEKADLDLIEWDHAFITYEIGRGVCFIHDLWVDPDHRRKKMAWLITDEVAFIAKKHGCDKLMASVMSNANYSMQSLLAQIAYGFKIMGSDSEKIYLVKEI